MIDYTKLSRKLIPPKDGEPVARLRVATVNAVNSDGTVDLLMASGVVVPGVPRLASAYVAAGGVVQVVSLRGSLLVIGAVAAGQFDGGSQLIYRTSLDTDGSAGASGVEVLMISGSLPVVSGRTYRVWTQFHATPGSAGAAGSVRIREGNGISGAEIRVAYAAFPNTGTAGNYFILNSLWTASSSGTQSFSATAQATGTTVRREGATNRIAELWVETA
jgi:hypothetical protein